MINVVDGILNQNNLWYTVAAFLPAMVYAIIAFFTSPKKTINLKKGFLYLLLGTVSVFFVQNLHEIFPYWQTQLGLEYDLSVFLFAFFQIAFVEELLKFLTFKLIYLVRLPDSRSDTPIATMFYCMMVAMGFGFTENFFYAMHYGGDILFIRAFTSMVCHMICGGILGYFYSLGKSNYTLGNRSVLDFFFRKNRIIKWISFSTFGLIVTSLYHGLYNYNLFSYTRTSYSFMLLLLILGFISTRIASSHLARLNNDPLNGTS